MWWWVASPARTARTPVTRSAPSAVPMKASGAASQTNSTPSSSAFFTSRMEPGNRRRIVRALEVTLGAEGHQNTRDRASIKQVVIIEALEGDEDRLHGWRIG